MYAHKAVDISFLSPKSDAYKFYNALIQIQALLYHSIHQSTEYISWLDTAATTSSKSILQMLSQKIFKELFIDFSIDSSTRLGRRSSQNNDAFLNSYKLEALSPYKPIPSNTDCDFELSKIYGDSVKLKVSTEACMVTCEKSGVKPTGMEKTIPALLLKINEMMDSSNGWKSKFTKVNELIFYINELLDINYLSAEKNNAVDAVNVIRRWAKQMNACIRDMMKARIDLSNLERINRWSGLIDKMTIGDMHVDLIKQDLKYFLKKTNLSRIVIDSIHVLSAINKDLLLFMKGVDENQYPIDFSKLKACDVLKALGVTFDHPENLSAVQLCELGNFVLQNGKMVPHPLLACEFFELAFIYAKDQEVKLLALCKLEAAYQIAIRGGYSIGFYDEAHIALYRYVKFIKMQNKSEKMLLRELKCQMTKFNIDVVKNNIYRDFPNKNLLNILFALDQNHIMMNPDLQIKLEEMLHPLLLKRFDMTLGRCNIESIERIGDIVSPGQDEDMIRLCRIQ